VGLYKAISSVLENFDVIAHINSSASPTGNFILALSPLIAYRLMAAVGSRV
jgi:hypothetical protein